MYKNRTDIKPIKQIIMMYYARVYFHIESSQPSARPFASTKPIVKSQQIQDKAREVIEKELPEKLNTIFDITAQVKVKENRHSDHSTSTDADHYYYTYFSVSSTHPDFTCR